MEKMKKLVCCIITFQMAVAATGQYNNLDSLKEALRNNLQRAGVDTFAYYNCDSLTGRYGSDIPFYEYFLWKQKGSCYIQRLHLSYDSILLSEPLPLSSGNFLAFFIENIGGIVSEDFRPAEAIETRTTAKGLDTTLYRRYFIFHDTYYHFEYRAGTRELKIWIPDFYLRPADNINYDHNSRTFRGSFIRLIRQQVPLLERGRSFTHKLALRARFF